MANSPSFANVPATGQAIIDGSVNVNSSFSASSGVVGNGVLLMSGSANGTRVQSINLQGGTTINSAVILWFYDGSHSFPIDIFSVPALTPSADGITPPWQQTKAYSLLLLPSGTALYLTTTSSPQNVAVVVFGANY